MTLEEAENRIEYLERELAELKETVMNIQIRLNDHLGD